MSVTANGWGSREKARLALRRSQYIYRSDEDTSASLELDSDDEEVKSLTTSNGLLQIAAPKQPVSRLRKVWMVRSQGRRYLSLHTSKDGSCFPAVKLSLDEIKRLVSLDPFLGNKDLDNDPVAKVLGRDGKGRVRGLGTGVSKAVVHAAAPYNRIIEEEKRKRETTNGNFRLMMQRLDEESRVRKILEEKLEVYARDPPEFENISQGVMMNHRNVLAVVSAVMTIVPGLGSKDVYLAYLPLAHILELAAENVVVAVGGSIGYGSPLTLTDTSNKVKRGTKGDASQLGPTVMTAVPAILDRVRDGVRKKVDAKGGLAKRLFDFAFGRRLSAMNGV